MADGRPTLRKQYRNVWCILRSLDRHEIDLTFTAAQWYEFRNFPHEYFIECDTPTSDAIWKAVEKRL